MTAFPWLQEGETRKAFLGPPFLRARQTAPRLRPQRLGVLRALRALRRLGAAPGAEAGPCGGRPGGAGGERRWVGVVTRPPGQVPVDRLLLFFGGRANPY